MNRTTSQWRSVSTGIPLARAIWPAIRSFHCPGSVTKPSASSSTLVSAITAVVISSSSWRRHGSVLLARGRHLRPEPGNLPPLQEDMPVDPLEHQLAQVVESRLAQERKRSDRSREAPRKGFGVVVEVDQQSLVEAGL